ncbi:hypothetical protein AB1399_04460, partial [Hydrogenibacillus schlegelii]
MARSRGISRNTVRRYLRATEVPKPAPRAARGSKLDPTKRLSCNGSRKEWKIASSFSASCGPRVTRGATPSSRSSSAPASPPIHPWHGPVRDAAR